MHNQNKRIKYMFHFFSEAIILFLLILPIIHFYYNQELYWEYLFVTAFLCIFYSFFINWLTDNIFYLAFTLIPFALFYITGFPLGLSLLLALILTWRFHMILYELTDPEFKYLIITASLTLLMLLLIGSNHLMVYLFLQFFILTIGFSLSHLQGYVRQYFLYALYLVAALIAGAFLIYFLHPLVYRLWDGIVAVIAFTTGKFVGIFEGFQFTFEWPEQEQNEQVLEQEKVTELPLILKFITPGLIVFMISLVIFAIIGMIILWKVIKKDKGRFKKTTYAKQKHLSTPLKNHFQPQHVVHLVRSLFKKPSHPVRKMIFDFERKAAMLGKERYRSETIEEWFERLDIEASSDVYQMIRYGDKHVDEREILIFIQQIKAAEKVLNHK